MKTAAALTALSLDLLKQTTNDPTRMISPLSLASALAMLAEGASGETLYELERLIGLPLDALRQTLSALQTTNLRVETAQFRTANSLWFAQTGFVCSEDYAARLCTHYAAEINVLLPAASAAADQINRWVHRATDGMIDRLVDENLLRGLRVLLINAICLDAEWEHAFAAQTMPDRFTRTDGSTVTAEFMQSKCEHLFIEREGALGFVKPYAGGKLNFAAILPPDEIALEDYLAQLNGEELLSLIQNPEICTHFCVKMPAFRADYSITLNAPLRQLGLSRVFGEMAELHRMGSADGHLYVDTILQKTHIDVNTNGTRAAAATSAAVMTTALMHPEEHREIVFYRPFLYVIFDAERQIPLFMGTVDEPSTTK